MKSHLYILAFLLTALIPASLFAQDSTKTVNRSAFTSPIADLTMPIPNLNMGTKKPLTKFDSNSSFSNFLPTRENTKAINIVENPEPSPRYLYNMPIAKPVKTSKILIAKLDKDFPYQYKMPVATDRGTE